MVSGLRMVLESLCCFKILCSKSKMTPPIVIERTPSIEEQVGKMYITQSFFKTVLFSVTNLVLHTFYHVAIACEISVPAV